MCKQAKTTVANSNPVAIDCVDCGATPQKLSFQKGRSEKNRVFRFYCPVCENAQRAAATVQAAGLGRVKVDSALRGIMKNAAAKAKNNIFFKNEKIALSAWNEANDFGVDAE